MLREALYSSSLAGLAFKNTVKSEGFLENESSSWLKDFLYCSIVRSLGNVLNHFLKQKKKEPLCPRVLRKALASYLQTCFAFFFFFLTPDVLEASPDRTEPNQSWLTLPKQPSFTSSLTFLHLPYRSWEKTRERNRDCTPGLQHCEKAEGEAHAKADLTKPLDGKHLPLLVLQPCQPPAFSTAVGPLSVTCHLSQWNCPPVACHPHGKGTTPRTGSWMMLRKCLMKGDRVLSPLLLLCKLFFLVRWEGERQHQRFMCNPVLTATSQNT